jgi:hypothetical protein
MSSQVGHSVDSASITIADFELMKRTAGMNEQDIAMLRASRAVLAPQTEAILDVWYGFVGSQPHLLHYFSDPTTNAPIGAYLDGVRKRFGKWIVDTAAANFDDKWLAQQLDIGRRHHRIGKNKTDNVRSVSHIPYRHIVPLLVPITTTLRPFLLKGGASAADVDGMMAAWLKAVTLQVTLWSIPYCNPGDF